MCSRSICTVHSPHWPGHVVALSNDGDLRLPIEQARQLVPVGINPSRNYLAGELRARTTGARDTAKS